MSWQGQWFNIASEMVFGSQKYINNIVHLNIKLGYMKKVKIK